MKCNPQSSIDRARAKEYELKEKQRQEYIDSLSEEEREEFLQKEKQKQAHAAKMFSQLLGIAGALGVKEEYGGFDL